MANKNIFNNLSQMDQSYLLDPSVQNDATNEPQKKIEPDMMLDIEKLIPFKNHPFHIDTDSDQFLQLVDSIQGYGILSPIIVRPSGDLYEIISGHCRTAAAKEVGLTEVPVKITDMDDFMATIVMTHSNINGRDKILVSEKAKAYRMCLDMEKHQGVKGADTAATIGAGKDSKRQVQRFVRLSYLTDDFLNLIDVNKLTIQIGTELAFLDQETQINLFKFICDFGKVPGLDQAKNVRAKYDEKKESLSYETIVALLAEPPKSTKQTQNKLVFKTKDIEGFFEEGTDFSEMSEVIYKLLAKYKAGEINDLS